MNDLFFTAAEVAGLPGMPKSLRSVARWMNSRQDDEWPSPPRMRTPEGPGRPAKELHISCFPDKTQAVLMLGLDCDEHAGSSSKETALDEESQACRAMGRYETAKHKDKKEGQRRLYAVAALHELLTQGQTRSAAQNAVSVELKVSDRTVGRWYDDVKSLPREQWLDKLTPAWGGGRPRKEVNEDVITLIADDFLRPSAPSWTSCYDRLVLALEGTEYSVPSSKKLKSELRLRYTKPEQDLLRKGKSYAKENLIPAQRRTVAHEHAMLRINGDGYEHNVMVSFPDGSTCRPHVWYWQDVYSRRILAWYIDKTENTDQIRLSFQEVITKYGIPEHIHVDNTRPAASKELSGGVPNRYRFKLMDNEALGLWPMLGCQVHFTSVHYGAGNGRAKPIERMFSGKGGFGDRIDKVKEFEGAYTGPNVMSKPENYGTRAVDLEDFARVVEEQIAAFNAKPGRRTETGQGKYSFDEVFAESYAKSVISMPSKDQLRLFSQKAETVKVHKSGLITLKSGAASGIARNEYWASDLRDHWAGQQVVARFDPANLHDKIFIYRKEGQFICEAQLWEAKAFGSVAAGREYSRIAKNEMKHLSRAADAREHKESLLGIDLAPQPKAPLAFKAAATRIVQTPHLGAKDYHEQTLTPEESERVSSTIVELETELNQLKNAPEEIDRDDCALCVDLYAKLQGMKEEGMRLNTRMTEFCKWFEECTDWIPVYEMMKDDISLSAISLPRGWE